MASLVFVHVFLLNNILDSHRVYVTIKLVLTLAYWTPTVEKIVEWKSGTFFMVMNTKWISSRKQYLSWTWRLNTFSSNRDIVSVISGSSRSTLGVPLGRWMMSFSLGVGHRGTSMSISRWFVFSMGILVGSGTYISKKKGTFFLVRDD